MRRQSRTRVLARRRRPPAALLPWLVLATALALGALQAARAQTTTPTPLPPKTEETGPTTAAPSAGTGQLQRGVIRPPRWSIRA